MTVRGDLISHFYSQDPFEGFTYTEDDVDYTGLSPDHPVFESALSHLRPSVIVEVGSWKGKSAITMAKILHRHHIDGVVICVDTWLGSPEHCLSPARHPTEPEHYESLRHKNGHPMLYQTFMANVVEQGMVEYIIPLPNTSDNAFEMLRKIGVTTDFVYIDAAHEYECVMRDIGNSWKSLRDGGILVLDDYLKWPGVTKAIDDFAADQDAKVYGEYMKAAIGKGVDIGTIWVPSLPR